MNELEFLYEDNIIVFLHNYRVNIIDIHYKLFKVPSINNRTSILTFFLNKLNYINPRELTDQIFKIDIYY